MVTHVSADNEIKIYSGDITKAGSSTQAHTAPVNLKVYENGADVNSAAALFDVTSTMTVTMKDPCKDSATTMAELAFAKQADPSTIITSDTIIDWESQTYVFDSPKLNIETQSDWSADLTCGTISFAVYGDSLCST